MNSEEQTNTEKVFTHNRGSESIYSLDKFSANHSKQGQALGHFCYRQFKLVYAWSVENGIIKPSLTKAPSLTHEFGNRIQTC